MGARPGSAASTRQEGRREGETPAERRRELPVPPLALRLWDDPSWAQRGKGLGCEVCGGDCLLPPLLLFMPGSPGLPAQPRPPGGLGFPRLRRHQALHEHSGWKSGCRTYGASVKGSPPGAGVPVGLVQAAARAAS